MWNRWRDPESTQASTFSARNALNQFRRSSIRRSRASYYHPRGVVRCSDAIWRKGHVCRSSEKVQSNHGCRTQLTATHDLIRVVGLATRFGVTGRFRLQFTYCHPWLDERTRKRCAARGKACARGGLPPSLTFGTSSTTKYWMPRAHTVASIVPERFRLVIQTNVLQSGCCVLSCFSLTT